MMKRTSKPWFRWAAPTPRPFYRPQVTSLEARLQPGESLLSWWLGGSLLGASLAFLDQSPAIPEAVDMSAPPGHRPALFQSLADQEQATGSPDEPGARAVEIRGG